MHKLKPFTPERLRRRIFGQLWMLSLQFLLGMGLNLIGEDTAGTSHILYNVILVIHILNGIGLLEGGIFVALKERGKLSLWTAIMLATALSGGVVFVFTHQDIWSFVMACGFLASSWLSVMLYIRADHRLNAKG